VLNALLIATDRRTKEVAWEAFVERYTPLLLRTAYRFASSYDEAMDRYTYLLEQLSHNDYRRLRAFAALGPGRFTTWLVVVARRLLLDHHRQRYGRPRLIAAKDREEARAASAMRRRLVDMVGEELHPSAIGDWSTNPEYKTYAAECARALQAAANSLEPRDQLLLKLRFDGDLGARAIAEVMGFPTQFQVYRRLKVVLAALRQMVPRAYREYVGAIQ
jgi:RNA polymerase sigma factor (sigma-70 family)